MIIFQRIYISIKKKSLIKNIIAEPFNKFFVNVGFNLVDKISPSSEKFESYLPYLTTQ